MANMSFFEDMQARKYRPVFSGGCSNCAAQSVCLKLHCIHAPHDSCYTYFMSTHGLSYGHWTKVFV